MNGKHREALQLTAELVMEQMAFLLPMPPDDAAEAEPDDARLHAAITFDGPFGGELLMSISQGVLPELACNMLGLMGEEPTAQQQHDAVKELLNVVCGNLLPEIASPQDVFNVHPPRILADPPAQPAAAPDSQAEVCFDTGRASLWLYVDRSLCA